MHSDDQNLQLQKYINKMLTVVLLILGVRFCDEHAGSKVKRKVQVIVK